MSIYGNDTEEPLEQVLLVRVVGNVRSSDEFRLTLSQRVSDSRPQAFREAFCCLNSSQRSGPSLSTAPGTNWNSIVLLETDVGGRQKQLAQGVLMNKRSSVPHVGNETENDRLDDERND